ncbi:MAG: M20/M25/M40 family metallo-hydrolase, partial [Gammaproteobacteria bacterium]|nr:M20/M25/M40 family metallo-hydrolase [Gammaproteobacteria bacterium]
EILASLTTEVGPRFAGTDGDKAAVAWALRTLKNLGFENVRAEPVEVPHWERGELHAAIVEPFPQELVAISLGGSVGTPEDGITAPLLQVDTLEALKKMSASKVRGKIVYINSQMERHADASGYGPAVQKRVYGAAEAARLGAVALVIRSVGTDSNRIAHTGTMRYEDGVKKIPAIALSNPDADLLDRQLDSGRDVSFHLNSSARHLPNEMSANVIGEIPGSGKDGEIVLLGAHLDSWDVGTGAVDDGAGVAIVTEAARLIGELKTPPRRTLRVVLYANEEFGLSGGKAYAKRHADELDQHVIAMEADLGDGQVIKFGGNVASDHLDALAAVHELLEKGLVDQGEIAWGGMGGYGGADIGPIQELGVPVYSIRQDATKYFDLHHTDNDTLDKVDPRTLNHNVAVYATAAYVAAMRDENFGRLPVEESED